MYRDDFFTGHGAMRFPSIPERPIREPNNIDPGFEVHLPSTPSVVEHERRAREFAETLAEASAREKSGIDYKFYKNALIDRFIDEDHMVCNRKVDRVHETDDDGSQGIFRDQGDAAWRTGLYAIALALEGDAERLIPVLQTLRDCWIGENQPLVHPKLKEHPFSRDQFIPQMAACLFAWRLGLHIEKNLKKVSLGKDCQNVAQGLLQKFVNVLAQPSFEHSNYQFGPNPTPMAGWFEGHEHWILSIISEEIGVHAWARDDEDNSRAEAHLFVQLETDLANSNKSDAFDYYRVHLLFWKMLCLWVVRDWTKIGPKIGFPGHQESNTIQHWLEKMATANVIHQNGLFFCAGNRVEEARELSKVWAKDKTRGKDHDRVDYFFQRNKKQQTEAMERREVHAAPLAPMLLHLMLNYPDYARPRPDPDNKIEHIDRNNYRPFE